MPADHRPRTCAVIGAGILGACLAARLAEVGLEVTLLEQDQPGSAATRSSFAWLNSNDKAPRAYHDLNHAGMRAWAALAASDSSSAEWYRPAGNIEWAVTPAACAQLAGRVRRLAGWGYRASLIGAAQAAELEPSLRLPLAAVSARSATPAVPAAPSALAAPAAEIAWFPDEGYLLTEPLVFHLTAAAARHGATILTGDQGRVTGFEHAGTTVTAVRTAAGQVIAADAVICSAGRWVPELAALAAPATPAALAAPTAPALVPLVPWAEPGAPAPGLVVEAGPVALPGPARIVHAPWIHLRPHSAGRVHLEAPDARVDLHTPGPELGRWAGELLRRARGVVSGLDDAEVTGYRVCVRPMPADGQSIAGWLPGAGHVYLAVTHSGVTLGAHLAQLITAELVSGEPSTELAPYRPSRFR